MLAQDGGRREKWAQAGRPSSVWPDEGQEWLIEAAFGDTAAWERWRHRYDLASIDAASQRLLPLLARKLPGSADRRVVQGVYRRSWVRNQLLFAQAGRAIEALEQAGIRTLLLKGVALSLLHYRDAGLRPMEDADVLVRPGDMAGAVAILRGLGWHPREEEPRSWPPPHQPGWPLAGPGGAEIDLHGYALAGERAPHVDQAFWDRSVPARLGAARTRALAPTDQLLHVVAHGLRWNAASPIRWVADALVILRGGEVRWDELLATAAARRRTRCLEAALSYLRRRFDAPVPAEVMDTLQAWPVSRAERLEHFFALRDHSGALGTLPNLWFAYRSGTAGGRDGTGFLRHLQEVWSIDGHVALARALVTKAARRAWHSVRLH
jgi:hypothetical protein